MPSLVHDVVGKQFSDFAETFGYPFEFFPIADKFGYWKVKCEQRKSRCCPKATEEMEAVMIIDILRRAKATVVVAFVEDKLEIVASRKVKLVADTSLEEAAKLSYNLIVLSGGLLGAQTFFRFREAGKFA